MSDERSRAGKSPLLRSRLGGRRRWPGQRGQALVAPGRTVVEGTAGAASLDQTRKGRAGQQREKNDRELTHGRQVHRSMARTIDGPFPRTELQRDG